MAAGRGDLHLRGGCVGLLHALGGRCLHDRHLEHQCRAVAHVGGAYLAALYRAGAIGASALAACHPDVEPRVGGPLAGCPGSCARALWCARGSDYRGLLLRLPVDIRCPRGYWGNGPVGRRHQRARLDSGYPGKGSHGNGIRFAHNLRDLLPAGGSPKRLDRRGGGRGHLHRARGRCLARKLD